MTDIRYPAIDAIWAAQGAGSLPGRRAARRLPVRRGGQCRQSRLAARLGRGERGQRRRDRVDAWRAGRGR